MCRIRAVAAGSNCVRSNEVSSVWPSESPITEEELDALRAEAARNGRVQDRGIFTVFQSISKTVCRDQLSRKSGAEGADLDVAGSPLFLCGRNRRYFDGHWR